MTSSLETPCIPSVRLSTLSSLKQYWFRQNTQHGVNLLQVPLLAVVESSVGVGGRMDHLVIAEAVGFEAICALGHTLSAGQCNHVLLWF